MNVALDDTVAGTGRGLHHKGTIQLEGGGAAVGRLALLLRSPNDFFGRAGSLSQKNYGAGPNREIGPFLGTYIHVYFQLTHARMLASNMDSQLA